jgi:hypothetical protein
MAARTPRSPLRAQADSPWFLALVAARHCISGPWGPPTGGFAHALHVDIHGMLPRKDGTQCILGLGPMAGHSDSPDGIYAGFKRALERSLAPVFGRMQVKFRVGGPEFTGVAKGGRSTMTQTSTDPRLWNAAAGAGTPFSHAVQVEMTMVLRKRPVARPTFVCFLACFLACLLLCAAFPCTPPR